MPESRFTVNGAARLHYLDTGGDDRGAPIVFVPGMTDVADDYAAVLPMLGRRAVVLVWALSHRDRVRSLSIGDYIPEEITLTEDIYVGLLDGRWRGTPVHSRLGRDAGVATFRPDRGRFPELVREHVDAVDGVLRATPPTG